MKKVILLAVATLLSITSLFAEEGKVSFGLELSPAMTWLNTSHSKIGPDGNSVKLNGGLILNINLGKAYSIVTGLRYNTYGGSFDGDLETREIKYEFNEFEIPIGLKLRTGSFGKMRFAAHLSTGMGIEFKPKETIVEEPGYDNKPVKDFKIMPIRALYNLGAGLEYDLGEVVLTGKVSYKGWFSNLFFYSDKMNIPTHQLELLGEPVASPIYEEKFTFQPSAVEVTFGVIF